MIRKTAFLYTPQFEKFPYPESCPFKTERAIKLRETLRSMGLLSGAHRREIELESADRQVLESIHSAEYLDALIASENGNWGLDALRMGIGGPDNPVFKGMYGYGALVAGASATGVRMLLDGHADLAFNPSGGHHHAMREKAAGFCYINDVAIACKMLSDHGKRVFYLDVDVHHGDGVQEAFYDSDQVMTVSIHESGKTLFPGTGFEDEIGVGPGRGYAVNLPMPADTYNQIYMRGFDEVVMPLAHAFAPDVIVLEIGADGLAGDPLAHLRLTNSVYVKILKATMALNIPMLVTGGGGYHVENTVRAWSLVWAVLNGDDQDLAAMNMGLGGVMLESTDWMGGLQDREIPVTGNQKMRVDPQVDAVVHKVKDAIFPIHGI